MNFTEQEKIWSFLPAASVAEEKASALAAETGLLPVVARLLMGRGYETVDDVRVFLNCEDTLLLDPFLLTDMKKAVARMRKAVEEKEKIVIYGDYDVDGVTSVSLLFLFLKEQGADVDYYIPSRAREGYGLSLSAVDKLHEQGVQCIITVDTGITANAETAHAKELGIDVVITDHHECRLPLPDAVAVVNPHRPDSQYPFQELAGVGVAFKFATAYALTLAREQGKSDLSAVREICEKYADLVAIGTVADVMPLRNENRLIVKYGLSLVEKNPRAGLAALIAEASAVKGGKFPKKKKINASFVGFTLAPRLNAAGRMSEASISCELLLSDEAHAAALAEKLCEINRERQTEENRVAEQAFRAIEEEPAENHAHAVVLADNGWRQGIIGIVASRVTERYGLPSILISFDGATRGFDSPDDLGKGSGRSVKGMNLVEALTDSENLLVKFGGHELAAGLTVRRDKIDDFRRRINAFAASHLSGENAKPTLFADCEIPLSAVSLELAEQLSKLEPFGVANPMPQFAVRGVTLEHIAELGAGKHLKLTVTDGERSLTAMAFSTSREDFPYRPGDVLDLLVTLDVNEFMGVRSVQMILQDCKPAQGIAFDLKDARERFAAVRAGAFFSAEEGFLPEREDFARVYTVLRREFRQGRNNFSEEALLLLVNAGAERRITYGCLKYILEIFHELKICGVQEEAGRYTFDMYFNASKTNIEKSSILKKLKSQCRSEGGDNNA